MNETDTRMTVIVSKELFERSNHIPHGLRSEILRIILEKLIDAGEKHGTALYGAIIDGEFDLVPRFARVKDR